MQFLEKPWKMWENIEMLTLSKQKKSKYGEKHKLCYMDEESFIVYIKQMIFIKTFKKILKLDLIPEIMYYVDHYQMGKIKK